jgi:hypothetical protein
LFFEYVALMMMSDDDGRRREGKGGWVVGGGCGFLSLLQPGRQAQRLLSLPVCG